MNKYMAIGFVKGKNEIVHSVSSDNVFKNLSPFPDDFFDSESLTLFDPAQYGF